MSTSLSGPRRRVLLPIVVLLGCALVYLATVATGLVNSDARSASLGGWRIASTGAPWMDDVDVSIADTTDPDTVMYDARVFNFEAPNGHMVVHRSPGVVAAAVPAYWLSGEGPDESEFRIDPGARMAALLAATSVLLLFLTLRSRMRDSEALLATAVFALTTPMWSVVGNSLWTHCITLLGIFGMSWAASRDRWWLVGLFGGIALWGRLHTTLIVAVLGLGVAWSRRRPDIAVKVGVVSGGFLGLASVWSHWMYGTWNPAGGYGSNNLESVATGGFVTGFWNQVANHFGLWVSPDRGVLVWTPLLLLLLPAVVREWRDLPDWARWLPVGGILYMLVQGQLNEFMGGDGFYGQRLGMEFLACVAPAYAFSAHRMGTWARRLCGPVVGLQFAAISVGALSEGFLLHREDAWTDNAFVLALRTLPVVDFWAVLMVVVGWLAGRVWQERRARAETPTPSPEVIHSAA